jgi:hypothetical protein
MHDRRVPAQLERAIARKTLGRDMRRPASLNVRFLHTADSVHNVMQIESFEYMQVS